MKIISPSITHLPQIISLWRKQYDYHHNLDKEYYVANSTKLDNIFESYLKKAIEHKEPNILIAIEDDAVLGFITFEIAEADYFDTNIEKYGEVIELFVEGTARKKGVGKKLMDSVEEFFRKKGLDWVELQASTYNNLAGNFYENLGYENKQTLYFKKMNNDRTEDKIKIISLNKKYLNEAIAMLDVVFPVQDELENADICLRASLNPSEYKKTLDEWKIPKLEYFIAIDTDNDKVVATSGIYEMEGQEDSAWVGWTSTHPDYRRKGLGRRMLKATLDEMRRRGYKIAKLHTVDIEDQKNAHKLYESEGFELKSVDEKAEIGHDRLYYEQKL